MANLTKWLVSIAGSAVVISYAVMPAIVFMLIPKVETTS
jgi:hypothetical protein